METVFNILIGFAIIVASAYIIAFLTIFILSVLGNIADEEELNDQLKK